ncbi:hypothetical protein L6164_000382 [Bauhinia variegata]|uniref:Uncharacterized protein n=1 Tax=Bauhinia variegata TaxID=167791 RepID=A0ACB9Q6C0_BAUVA|nr:hypothetical protein L6164_000382 [Bauhinia variegata]
MEILSADIPRDLVEGILTELPTKSLNRFRCVSKGFDALISEPQFGKLQYEKACRNPFDINHHKIFVLDGIDLLCLHGDAISSKPVISNSDFEEVDTGFPFSDKNEVTISSCGGLICFSRVSVTSPPDIFLWNSLNKDIFKVPRSKPIDNAYYREMGFGYDHSTDDYKVVMPFMELESTVVQAEIFSLRNQAWRKVVAEKNIGQFIFPCPQSGSVTLKGKVCWLGFRSEPEIKRMIMCFDVVKEKFHLVQPPAHTRDQAKQMEMGVLGGVLGVCINESGIGMAIWLMKDLHAAESWTKVAVIPTGEISRFSGRLKPLFVNGNGEILMFCPYIGTLLIYNLKERKSRIIFRFKNIRKVKTAITHMESLLSCF